MARSKARGEAPAWARDQREVSGARGSLIDSIVTMMSLTAAQNVGALISHSVS